MADMADTPERFRVHESGAYFHGTKADLEPGDFLVPGYRSNYRPEHISNYIYMTKVLDGAVLAAEMAVGEGRPRVYIVQPTGSVEDDPNVTDKKFPAIRLIRTAARNRYASSKRRPSGSGIRPNI